VSIAGDGPERAALERQSAGLPITFVGALETPRDVASFLRQLDVFVLPSRFEGRPNVLLEARACGLPAVVALVEGTISCAQLGGIAFVPPDDPEALARTMRTVATSVPDPGCPALPDFAAVADAHLRVFHEAVARRSSRLT
jgi:glycosyltransferase involved in cell wall biosynthesis